MPTSSPTPLKLRGAGLPFSSIEEKEADASTSDEIISKTITCNRERGLVRSLSLFKERVG